MNEAQVLGYLMVTVENTQDILAQSSSRSRGGFAKQVQSIFKTFDFFNDTIINIATVELHYF